jgi:hypothetical protein
MIRRSDRTKKTKEMYSPNAKKKVNNTKHKQSKQAVQVMVRSYQISVELSILSLNPHYAFNEFPENHS